MAGGNHPKGPSHKTAPSSSSHHRKSRWESDHPTAADKKSSGAAGDSKQQPPPKTPKDNSTPKSSGPNPSPSQPNPPTDPVPNSGVGQSRSEFPFQFPDGLGPPPPPSYGFHMLERRTIALSDGNVRSYFALPPDYQDFTPPPRGLDHSSRLFPHGPGFSGPDPGFDKRFPPFGPMSPEFRDREEPFARNRNQDYWNSLGLDGRDGPVENSLKRKFGDEAERSRREERKGKDEFARERQQLLKYGGLSQNEHLLGASGRGDFSVGTSSSMYPKDRVDMGGIDESRAAKFIRVSANVGLKHHDVDQAALKKAFMNYAKLVNENVSQKKNYLEDGKQGPLHCIACGRPSKDFPDMHSLIMHTYNPDNANMIVDHLGLHKALCVLMGWNYANPPDNSKAYQFLSADEASANQDDLIMWPPMVIIQNTITGKGRDGRIEGLGNKAMDTKLRELGFGSGKSKSLYGRDGHLGITLIKFAGDPAGLREAERLADYYEKDNHGRKGWTRLQLTTSSGKDDESNPHLVKVDEHSGEKKRILYAYMGTVCDLDKLDFETRKKVVIESRRDHR